MGLHRAAAGVSRLGRAYGGAHHAAQSRARWCAGMPTSTTCASSPRAALPVVRDRFAEPGADAQQALRQFLAQHPARELVVKPAVGAGSRDTRRHARAATAEIVAHLGALLGAGRSVLLQPYLDERGRARRDRADLHRRTLQSRRPQGAATAAGGAGDDGAVRAPSRSARAPPGPMSSRSAERVLAQLPFDELLYARVDLIRDGAHAAAPARAGAHRAVAVLFARPRRRWAPRRGGARAACAALKSSRPACCRTACRRTPGWRAIM